MSLEKIKGTYDAVFSLGNLCLGAIQLNKFNLRPFSGVLDWVGSHSLPDVNRLLQNRFSGFLELPNLKVVGHASVLDLLVLDEAYKIYFNHDFKTDKNTVLDLALIQKLRKNMTGEFNDFWRRWPRANEYCLLERKAPLKKLRNLDQF